MNITKFITTLSILLTGCINPASQRAHDISLAYSRADARLDLAHSYLQQQRYRKARENLLKAETHAADYYRTLLVKAHYYQQVAEMDKAKHTYQRALKLHPSNGYVLNDYGAFLCRQSDYPQADIYFNLAVKDEAFPHIASSYENAAYCAIKAQHTQKAIHYFQRALDYQPERYSALIHLVQLEIEHNQLEQARNRLTRLQQQYEQHPQLMQLQIKLEQKAGNHLTAFDYQRHLKQQSPHKGGHQQNSKSN
ncbi:type IV pilus biogenesis/stability protein PilW [Vibrio panuliri]|uniref:Type IV pilus biogenesis/stability protein PilW n=1 Tax=Vibrio panuliri TaxID=1381081 RepID=A0A1Q9HFF3_9VIBR|nr:type IV pilus biogenesis/stability protein PilW [Vibrio panuliri]OLQ88464.1 type IV pilus biogenesis/stability protein PilW [Vibrio panuliri]